MTEEIQKNKGFSRRTVVKGAAWSVPVIAAAVATPLAAASAVDIGAFELEGSCGILGVLGPGFTLTAGPTEPIPAGTTITITGSGIGNIGIFSVTGGLANINVLSPTTRSIVLTAPVAPGATISFRSTLSISVFFTLNGVATLPAGYTGTGGKTTGSVNATLILCSDT